MRFWRILVPMLMVAAMAAALKRRRDRGFRFLKMDLGLGIEELNEELIVEHGAHDAPPPWEPTDRWDGEWSHDRTWS